MRYMARVGRELFGPLGRISDYASLGLMIYTMGMSGGKTAVMVYA